MTDKLKAIIHGVTGEDPQPLIELLGQEIRATLYDTCEDYFDSTRASMHPDDRIGQDIRGSIYEVTVSVRRINEIITPAISGENRGDGEEHF